MLRCQKVLAQRCLPGYPIASGSLTIASPRFRRCCGRPAYVPVDARPWVVVHTVDFDRSGSGLAVVDLRAV